MPKGEFDRHMNLSEPSFQERHRPLYITDCASRGCHIGMGAKALKGAKDSSWSFIDSFSLIFISAVPTSGSYTSPYPEVFESMFMYDNM